MINSDRKDRVFFAATMIVTKQVTAEKTHASPGLVKQAVDLAEMIVDEIERRELAIEEAPAEPPPSQPPEGFKERLSSFAANDPAAAP